MRRTHRSGVIGCAVIAATAGGGVPASGQETARLIIQVEPAVIAPGQSALVRVFVGYNPTVGSPAIWNTIGGTGSPGTVAGFSVAAFDLFSKAGPGVSGSWSNLAFGGPWASPFSTAGVVSGSSVLDVRIGTGFGPPVTLAVTDNPLLIWSAS